MIAFAITGQLLDATSTGVALHKGYHETNPLLKPQPLVIKGIVSTLGLYGVHKLEPKHPKLAKVLYIASGVSGSVAFTINVERMK